jgi:hypothetical protein
MGLNLLIPRSTTVVLTFNGYQPHLQEGRCYRRVLDILLKRPVASFALLLPDTKEIPFRTFVGVLEEELGQKVADMPCCVRTHHKVLRYSSTLVLQNKGHVRSCIFDFNSRATIQDEARSQLYLQTFA